MAVLSESILSEAPTGVAYAPVDFNRQVGVVVKVTTEVYKILRMVVLLVDCLNAEFGGSVRHLPRAQPYKFLASERVAPKAVHTITIPIIIY